MKLADQAQQRRYQLFRDQHNREWGANVEISTGHPTGGRPSPRFQAPLMPPAKYLRIDDRRPGRLTIDYAAWVADLETAKRAYVTKGRRYGFEKYGALFDPSKPFTEEVLLYLGPEPKPVEPVRWAQAGNRWVLGLLNPDGSVPDMPEALAPYFVTPPTLAEQYAEEFTDTAPVEDGYEPPAPTVPAVSWTVKPRGRQEA